MEIQNKVAVVTGAARGIGLGIAEKFLQEGAKHIIILDINEQCGVEVAATLNKKFGTDKVHFYKCDVTSDLESVFEKIISQFKLIDILVNNAGVDNEDCLRNTIAVNTVATIEWTMKFWEHARKDKGGRGGTVINVASIYGYIVDPFLPFYKASKHAVVGFTKTIGHKINYEQTGVRVIVICPGRTMTNMANNVEIIKNHQYQSVKFAKFINKMIWLTVDEVAAATVEMFKKSDSGSSWSIIGGESLKEITLPLEYRSEYLIKDEL